MAGGTHHLCEAPAEQGLPQRAYFLTDFRELSIVFDIYRPRYPPSGIIRKCKLGYIRWLYPDL